MPMQATATTTLPPRSRGAEREVQRDTPLRQARHCYDHLAGVAGVALFDALLERGWIAVDEVMPGEHRPACRLTEVGAAALAARGLDLARLQRGKRKFAYACLDWTERRPHLGGALGAEIMAALERASVTRRSEHARDRVMLMTAPLTAWLDG